MYDYGDGSRGIIGILPERVGGEGHAINVINHKDRVYFIDTQNPKTVFQRIEDLQQEYAGRKIKLMRTKP